MAFRMMHAARVMLWLRWRLLLNLLRPTRKRDTLERASRLFQVIGPIILVIIFFPAVLMFGFAGALAGWFLPQPVFFHRHILLILRILLAVELGLTLLAPLLRAAQASVPNVARLILLPIPIRALYVSEVTAAFADPWTAILTSGTLCLALGMAAVGEWFAAVLALVAGAALRLLVTGISTLSTSLAQLVFRDRKRGEMVSFILLSALAILGFLPGLFSTWGPGRDKKPPLEQVEEMADKRPVQPARTPDAPGWSGDPVPLWSLVYPQELYVRAVAQASDHAPSRALLPLLPLLAWTAGVHWIGGRVYRRLLETPEVTSPRRGSGDVEPRWPRVPWVSDAASAVAVTQVRLVLRSVQGKIQTFILPATVLVLGILWVRRPQELLPAGFPIPAGLLLGAFGVFLAMTTLEGTLLNQFAADRSGLTLEFLAPISDRDLIVGKAAGGAVLAVSRAIPSVIIAAAVAPGGSPLLWLCLPLAGAALFAIMAPVGAILSATLPKAVDPGRLAKQNQPHPMAVLCGMVVSLLALAPIAGLSAAAVLLFESPAAALLFNALYAGAALLLALPLLGVAEKLLAQRRENLALVAQGR